MTLKSTPFLPTWSLTPRNLQICGEDRYSGSSHTQWSQTVQNLSWWVESACQGTWWDLRRRLWGSDIYTNSQQVATLSGCGEQGLLDTGHQGTPDGRASFSCFSLNQMAGFSKESWHPKHWDIFKRFRLWSEYVELPTAILQMILTEDMATQEGWGEAVFTPILSFCFSVSNLILYRPFFCGFSLSYHLSR